MGGPQRIEDGGAVQGGEVAADVGGAWSGVEEFPQQVSDGAVKVQSGLHGGQEVEDSDGEVIVSVAAGEAGGEAVPGERHDDWTALGKAR